MGRVDGTSRDNGRPNGVADGFQVRMHSVEPMFSNRCRNLLSHNNARTLGCNEAGEGWPEVTFVCLSRLLSCDRERLAGTASCPQLPVIRPSCNSGGKAPSADPGEEVALRKSSKVIWPDIDNAPLVNFARGDMSRSDKVSEPLSRIGVKFVVVGWHLALQSYL